MMVRLRNRDYDSFEEDQHKHLETKIGYAFYGPPQTLNGYDERHKTFIDKAILQILKHNSKYINCHIC